MRKVELRMKEQEKYEVIKELVDHNLIIMEIKIELVKSSVYLEDKLIVLLSNIRRKVKQALFTETEHESQ